MQILGKAPFRGTFMPELLPGLRRVTKNQAIFHFDVDDGEKTLRVLAIFFGGQDYQRHMLKRVVSSLTSG